MAIQIRFAWLILTIFTLTACSAGGKKAPSQIPMVFPTAETNTATITPNSTRTRLPTYAAAYPSIPMVDPAYPYPPIEWTPGPDMGYPAEVLTITAKAPAPIESITSTLSITSSIGTPTITAFPTRSDQPELASPCDVYAGLSEYPMPELADLQWQEVLEDGKPANRLYGFSVPFSPLVPSPDGPGVALPFIQGSDGQTVHSGLLVVDGSGKIPWQAIKPTRYGYLSFQWLPGNRLLWIEGGNLYSALADGSKKIHYGLSEPVVAVWSNGKMAMVSGEHNLWLLDLTTETWTIKMSNVSMGYASAVMAPDGKYLYINNSGTLLQIPMNPSGKVIQYKTLLYNGSGGWLQPPIAMVGSPYIFPGVREITQDRTLRFVVFKSGEYEPIAVESLIGKAEVHDIYAMDVSGDGKWVIFSFLPSGPSSPEAQYLTPSHDLKSGRIITGHILGWRENPPTVFMLRDDLVVQIFLPYFKEKILGRFSYLTERSNLFQVSVGPNGTAVLNDNQLFMYDSYGNFQSKYNLPYHNRKLSSLTQGRNGNFYLAGWDGKPNGDVCDVTYWVEILEGQ